MKTFIDYYEVLEVRENASDEVIKMAYKALALKYHPDRNGDTKINAHSKMQIINEAYTMLSNPEKRKQYDQLIKTRTSAKNNNNEYYSRGNNTYGNNYHSNTNNDDLHKKRERERMYEEAKVRAEKEKYEEEIRRQEEVKTKAEEYKNRYSNEQNGDQNENGFSENKENRNNTYKSGKGFVTVFIVIVIMVVFASYFSNLGGSSIELNPTAGTPSEKAERANRAIRLVKDSFSSNDGPEVWVKNGNSARAYDWIAYNFDKTLYFVAYEFDNDTNKENGYSQYTFEVDLSSGIVKSIGGDSYLEKKYRELGFID